MIPLRDDQPTNSFPLVTILLIVANVLVYLVQQSVPGFTESYSMVPFEVTHHRALDNVVAHFTNAGPQLVQVPAGQPVTLGPDDIYYGVSPRPLWLTIFTAMFLHGSLLHIGGNMLYLWIFGNNVEDALGKVRYLVFYFVCGFIAAVAQILSGPGSLVPTLGASGAIAGVLGAYWLLYPDARVLTIVPVFLYFLAPIRAYWVLGFWIVLQVFQGVEGLGMQRGGGVAYFAHIGGFVAGLVIIQMLGGRGLAVRQRRLFNTPGHY